jgi:hypothetical protein
MIYYSSSGSLQLMADQQPEVDEKSYKPETNIYDTILQVFVAAIQRGSWFPC